MFDISEIDLKSEIPKKRNGAFGDERCSVHYDSFTPFNLL